MISDVNFLVLLFLTFVVDSLDELRLPSLVLISLPVFLGEMVGVSESQFSRTSVLSSVLITY